MQEFMSLSARAIGTVCGLIIGIFGTLAVVPSYPASIVGAVIGGVLGYLLGKHFDK